MKSDILTIDNTKQINREKIIESIAYWIEKIKTIDSPLNHAEDKT